MRTLLLLATLLVFPLACGDSDGTDGGNNGSGGGVSEILPTGFDRVASARISNDGTRIALVVEKGDDYALITTSITGEDIEEFTVDGLGYLSTIAWASDDSALYFSGDGITRVGVAGGVTEQVVDAFAVASFDVSPDDSMIAWTTNGGTQMRVASLATVPVVTADATAIDTAKQPRFSPDSKMLLTIIGSDFTTMGIDGSNQVLHAGGAGYLSGGAWIDNDSFMFLGDKKIGKYKIGSKEESTVNSDGFATTNLDCNKSVGKYIFQKNGQEVLFVSGF